MNPMRKITTVFVLIICGFSVLVCEKWLVSFITSYNWKIVNVFYFEVCSVLVYECGNYDERVS